MEISKFKAKSQEVEAFQYKGEIEEFPFKDVRRSNIIIRYSIDKKYYYLEGRGEAKSWFSTKKILEEPDQKKAPFMGSWVSIKLPDGTKYWRENLPFAFWSVKSGEEVEVTEIEKDGTETYEGNLVKDYASGFRWEYLEGYTRVFDYSTKHQRVLMENDWVVKEKDGYRVYGDKEFKERYE